MALESEEDQTSDPDLGTKLSLDKGSLKARNRSADEKMDPSNILCELDFKR